MGFGAILSGAGLLASAIGGSKKKHEEQVTQKTGFEALPKEVQSFLMDTYLPQVEALAASPYRNVPMVRATNPATDPFASRALWDLQKYSDATGGLFSPYGEQRKTPDVSSDAPGVAFSSSLAQQYLDSLMSPRGGMNTPAYNVINQGLSAENYTIDDLGAALQQQGYHAQSTPSQINFDMLLEALS